MNTTIAAKARRLFQGILLRAYQKATKGIPTIKIRFVLFPTLRNKV